jgi:hypothetical protein
MRWAAGVYLTTWGIDVIEPPTKNGHMRNMNCMAIQGVSYFE